MKRFRPRKTRQSTGNWTRRSALAAAAGLAAGAGEAFAQAGPGAAGMALWPREGAAVLRGAVIAQRRRRLSVDGETFGGGRAVLPAYGAAEFDALARAGANLVVMSFPELWTVTPPWQPDAAMVVALHRQLELAKAAGLYTVLALRSGPGRSDFIFHREAAGTWFAKELIVESIWTDRQAQAAWSDMCVDAAKILAGYPNVAGLNIMVEPEPNVGGTNRQGRPLGAWSPGEYRAQVSSVSDWKRIAGDIARAVRKAAPRPADPDLAAGLRPHRLPAGHGRAPGQRNGVVRSRLRAARVHAHAEDVARHSGVQRRRRTHIRETARCGDEAGRACLPWRVRRGALGAGCRLLFQGAHRRL